MSDEATRDGARLVAIVAIGLFATYKTATAIVEAWHEPAPTVLSRRPAHPSQRDVIGGYGIIAERCGFANDGAWLRQALRGEARFTSLERQTLEDCARPLSMSELVSISSETDAELEYESLRYFAQRRWRITDGRVERLARAIVPTETDLELTAVEQILIHGL